MNKYFDKLQSTGLLAGFLAIVCVPCILAPLLISVGLSAILVFLGEWLTPFLLILVALSLIGFTLSYRIHKNFLPLAMALIAGGTLYYSNYVVRDRVIGYVGAALLIAAIATDYVIGQRHKTYCERCGIKSKQ